MPIEITTDPATQHQKASVLGVDGYGRWIALRRDGQAALIADCPDSLLAAIRADCMPGVPRD